MTSFGLGVVVGFVGVCLYSGWLERRQRRVIAPVSSGDVERIYEPLYAWVLDAEENGTISGVEAAEAFDALIEAEGLEWQFMGLSGTDGPGEQTR